MTFSSAPVVRTEAANREERIVQCRHIQAHMLRHQGSLAGSPARGAGFSNDLRRFDGPAGASRLPLRASGQAAAPLGPVPMKQRTVAAGS